MHIKITIAQMIMQHTFPNSNYSLTTRIDTMRQKTSNNAKEQAVINKSDVKY